MHAGELDLNELSFPVVLRPNSPVSDHDLLRFSRINEQWRIERNPQGELILMTPVTGKGGWNEGYVSRIFLTWAEENGEGIGFSPNVGFNLEDGSTLSPDASWIPMGRWNALTPEQQDSFLPLCPEFLIEIRSKTDSRRMVEAKMQTWMDNGARLAWLVDPLQGTVTIYRAGREAETLERPEFVTADESVAGFTLPCARLWASAG